MQKYLFSLLFTLVVVFGVLSGQVGKASTTYKVEKGDSLWEIANDKNISIEDLITLNDLSSSLIFPGQEIKISSKDKVYIVQKGDTLSEIAETHNVQLTDLKQWNNIGGHLIFPGEELILQSNNGTTAAITSESQEKAAPSSQQAEKKAQKQSPPPQQSQTKETTATEQVPTAASGKEMTVTATAYTAYCDGCSGTTYTGIDLRANPNQKVIAVDPSIIPLGSRVWVEGYGEAIAGDIGGAIKGNIIDVFLENKQDAYNWGRRTVKIKVLN